MISSENESPVSPQRTQNDKTMIYREVYNNSPLMIHLVNLEGKIVFANNRWLQIMEYTLNEVIGTESIQYLTDASKEKVLKLRPEIIRTGAINYIELQAITKYGKSIDILIGSKTIADADGKPEQMVTTMFDITERRQIEQELRQRGSYLTAIIENQPGLVWLKDAEGKFLTVNQSFAQSCGKNNPEELIGKTDLDIWPPELAEQYRLDDERVMKCGIPVNVEEQIFDKGERRWFETFKTPIKNAKGEIIGTTGYARDITSRKLEMEALHNMQKLESLGILAGGIAHDFNNLLGGLFGFVNLAMLTTTEPEVAEMLENALSSLSRARGLTQQLLTFAKGGAPVKKVESLVPFIQDSVKFALCGSRVSCEFNIQPDLWSCEIDKNQIGQVIDNMVINAHQAMPNGGIVSIRAENLTVTELGGYTTLKPGHYVKISVTDHGTGIPQELLSRIFDPFFTTKKKGHGLGLATSFSIVHRHGGTIDVESVNGQGSTFRFYLPAIPNVQQTQVQSEQIDSEHTGTIIIMDDDDMILNALSQMLKVLGYTVFETHNGNEAVEMLRSEITCGSSVDLMLLDLTVSGGLGGLEVIAKIKSLEPLLPVFVASGYADNPVVASPESYGFAGSICKPFSITELSEKLKQGRKSK